MAYELERRCVDCNRVGKSAADVDSDADLQGPQDVLFAVPNPCEMVRTGFRASLVLNVFWIPLAFQESALMAIAVPSALLALAPRAYTATLAILATLVGIATVAVPPLAGALSDRMRERGEQRRALILIGAGIDVAALLALAHAHSVVVLGVMLILATIGANMSLAAYQALLPDIFPRASWGAVSGVRGAATLLGTLIGLSIAGSTDPGSTFTANAVLIGICAFTLFAVPERRAAPDSEERAHVRDWHDFVVVFIGRAWVVFGLVLLSTYILYFFHDILKVNNAAADTGLAAGASVVGAILSSIWLGRLSDRVSRKKVVALTGIPMTIGAVGFALLPDLRFIFAFALLFGFGYGGVLSTGWALAIDSMPRMRDVARDLGIWGLASNFPGVIAPAFGGWLLTHSGNTLGAYQLLFAIAGASFAIGSLTVLLVRGYSPPASRPEASTS